MKFRVNEKRLTGKYLEVRLKEYQGYYICEVLGGELSDWQTLKVKDGSRPMFRNRIDMLNKLYDAGWEFKDFTQKYKGNNATYLMKNTYG